MDAITFFVPSKPVQWHRADQSTILCKACAGKGKIGQGLKCPKCKGRGFFTPRHQPTVDKSYQKLLMDYYLEAVQRSPDFPRKPYDWLCVVDVVAVYLLPKDRPKWLRDQIEDIWAYVGDSFPSDRWDDTAIRWLGKETMPDRDNIIKQVGDGLDGVAWADDKLICDGRECKVYGPVPGLHVRIRRLTKPVRPGRKKSALGELPAGLFVR